MPVLRVHRRPGLLAHLLVGRTRPLLELPMTTNPCPKCGQTHDPTRCTGHNRKGLPCGNRPIRGGSVCSTHGGSAPQVRAKAEERQVEAAVGEVILKLWRSDVDPVTDSVSAMQSLAGQLRHVAEGIGVKLEDGDLDGPRERAWIRAVRELRQLLADMERLGIAERVVELKKAQAQFVVSAVMPVLELVPVERRDEALGLLLRGLGLEDGGDVVTVAGEVVAS